MTPMTFAKRVICILVAFGFAALFKAVMNADATLLSHGLAALLPMGLVGLLVVRIALKSTTSPR